MKYNRITLTLLLLLIFGGSHMVSAQIMLTTSEMQNMTANKQAAEGDVYQDTITGDFYIGLQDGTFRFLQDHNWHQASRTESAQDINSDIFTMGKVGIGVDDPAAKLQVATEEAEDIVFSRFDNSSTDDLDLDFIDGNGTPSSPIAYSGFSSGERIGGLRFRTYNSPADLSAGQLLDAFPPGAEIAVETDGNHSTTSAPARIIFGTTPEGSNRPIDRMVIKENGRVGIGTLTPQAQLDIDKGSVKFSDYGGGTVVDGSPTYILAVDADGDVVEQSLSGVGTDNQDLSLSGNTLSLTNDPSSVDLSPYLDNTDAQTITDLSVVNGDDLSITISNGNTTSVDLAPLKDQDWYEVGGLQADDITDQIYTMGRVGVNRSNPDYALHVESENPTDAGPFAQIEGGGNILSNVALRLYDKGTAANNENMLDFAHNPGTSSAVTMGRVKTRTHTANHSTGADLILEAASNNTGTLNANQLVLDNTGNVGIGIADPAAKLDVDGGSVRFSDYGVGTYLDSLSSVDPAVHSLAVDAEGDVVETNTAKANKIFYPPPLVIDVGALADNVTLDLYQSYIARYASPQMSSSTNPIPTYTRDELEYHVLESDGTVFNLDSLSEGGVLQYDVISVPASNCTFLSVVFVVK